jgi:hypothetical protein
VQMSGLEGLGRSLLQEQETPVAGPWGVAMDVIFCFLVNFYRASVGNVTCPACGHASTLLGLLSGVVCCAQPIVFLVFVTLSKK